MKLTLVRDEFTDKSTGGSLFVDGDFFCYTLEDRDRRIEDDPDAKIYGQTAIPRGTYKMIVNESPRFKRLYPRLLDVPGYQGILMHEGNTDADTEGCILVGLSRSPDRVNNSVAALKKLMGALAGQDDITIEIM